MVIVIFFQKKFAEVLKREVPRPSKSLPRGSKNQDRIRVIMGDGWAGESDRSRKVVTFLNRGSHRKPFGQRTADIYTKQVIREYSGPTTLSERSSPLFWCQDG